MTKKRRGRYVSLGVVVALLLLAFTLRTHTLGGRELTFDEAGSVYIAARGPLGVVGYVRGAIREHPPLYYLLLSLWMPLTGQSEFAVRFLSVTIGMTSLAVMYRLLRRASSSLALLTTLLMALSPFHVRASQDARMYGLLALWSLLSILFFIRLLERGGAQAWIGFWVVVGLGMFTHYFMAFVLAAADLFLLFNWQRYRRLLARWLIIHVALAGSVILWTFISPGLWATLASLWRRGPASQVRWKALSRALNGLYLGMTLRPNWHHLGLLLILTVLGIGLARRGTRTEPWKNFRMGLLLSLQIGVPMVAILALPERVTGRYLTTALPASVLAMGIAIYGLFLFMSDRLPASNESYSLPTVPGQGNCLSRSEHIEGRLQRLLRQAQDAFICLFRQGVERLDERLHLLVSCALPFALLFGVILVDARAYSSIYHRGGESFQNKMDYVETHARPGDGLLFHGPWQRLLSYYYGAGTLRDYTIPMQGLEVEAESAAATLTDIFDDHDRVWVSYDSVDPVDPDGIVARWLHGNAHQVWADGSLVLYYPPPVQELPSALTDSESDGAVGPDGPFRLFLPLVVRDSAEGYAIVERTKIAFGHNSAGGNLRLEGVALSNPEPVSEEAVLILTRWRALRDISHGLMLRFELIGLDGNIWETYQCDVGPARSPVKRWTSGEVFVERRGLVVPPGAPPGDYTLGVRVLTPKGVWSPLTGDQSLEIGSIRVRHVTPPKKTIQALPGRELYAVFGDTLALAGYAPWGRTFTQGNPLLFDVYWQALISPEMDYELEVRVVGNDGTVLTERRLAPVAGWFPTSRWRAGDLLRGHYAIPLPMDAPPGRYQIRLSIHASDGTPLPVSGTRTGQVLDWWEREQALSGTDVLLFEAEVEARPRRYRPPAMEHRIDAVFGDDVQLLGYDLASESIEPGGKVDVTLYWKALRRMEPIYAVFNHLLDSDGDLLAQEDGWPQEGAYHTNQWLAGEIVKDHYTIPVPPDAQPGEYELLVGIYNAATDERPVTRVEGTPVPERYVELTTISVESRQ